MRKYSSALLQEASESGGGWATVLVYSGISRNRAIVPSSLLVKIDAKNTRFK